MKTSVVTLGTFDGVHRGHQKILRKVIERARHLRARSVVLAFGMPPKLGHRPAARSVLLTTLQDKLAILKRLGINETQILVFNRKTASTPPDVFFVQKILNHCGAREMVVGPRVAFGRNRSGRLPLLNALGKRYSVRIHVVHGVKAGGQIVSSSAIRDALYRGDIETANRLLGYFYSLSGRVVHGSHRGRHLGYPTANIAVDGLKILPPGVFWVKVLPANSPVPFGRSDLRAAIDGLCNVGTRPTFTPLAKKLICEVYLFKKPPRLYGKHLRVVFRRRIRAERRFRSIEQLKRRITMDFQIAHRWCR